MEYLNALSESGDPRDQIVERDEAHRLGVFHGVVHVWCVTNKRDILLQKRSPRKENFPNLWDISCAGHIAAGETSRQAAIRELSEELGLSARKSELRLLNRVKQQLTLNQGTYLDNEWADVYILTIDKGTPFNLRDGEASEVKWSAMDGFFSDVSSGGNAYVPHPAEYEILYQFLKSEIRA